IARRCAGVTSDRYSGKARLESATASAFSISANSLSMCRHATDKRRAWFELRDCSGIKLHGRRKTTRPAQLVRSYSGTSWNQKQEGNRQTKPLPREFLLLRRSHLPDSGGQW